MARRRRRKGKNEKPSEKSPQKGSKTSPKLSEGNLQEDLFEPSDKSPQKGLKTFQKLGEGNLQEDLFEASENFTDDLYDLVKKQLLTEDSPESISHPVSEPLIPAIKIKQEPIDYEYEVVNQNSSCPTSSAAEVFPFVPIKIKEEPKSDDEDTINIETYELMTQKDVCTNSNLSANSVVPCTKVIKQEKLDEIAGQPHITSAAPAISLPVTPESPPVAPEIPRPVALEIPRPVALEIPRSVAPEIPRSVAPEIPLPVAPEIPLPVAAEISSAIPLTTTKEGERLQQLNAAKDEGHVLLPIKIKEEPKDNEDYISCSEPKRSFPSQNAQSSAAETASLVTNTDFTASATNTFQVKEKATDNMAFQEISPPKNNSTPKFSTSGEDMHKISPPVNSTGTNVNIPGVQIKKEIIETVDCSVTHISKPTDICAQSLNEIKNEKSKEECVITNTLPRVTNIIDASAQPFSEVKKEKSKESVTNTLPHVTDIIDASAQPFSEVKNEKSKEESVTNTLPHITDIIDACVQPVTEVKEEKSKEDSVIANTLPHVTDIIEPVVLKPVKQEPLDKSASCARNNTEESVSNCKEPNLTLNKSFLGTANSQCHLDLPVDSKSDISTIAVNNMSSHFEKYVPGSVCMEESPSSNDIPVKPEIPGSVEQMHYTSYEDSLSFLGPKWANPTIFSCEKNDSLNWTENDTSIIPQPFPPSLEELQMYLLLDCNIDSSDVEHHAKVVSEHLNKKKESAESDLIYNVPNNLPQPKELKSSLKTRALSTRQNTDLNHLKYTPPVTETSSCYKDVPATSWSPELKEDIFKQMEEKLSHHVLPVQSQEKASSPANCVSIETLRNIVNAFNLGSVSTSQQLLSSASIASVPVMTSDSFTPLDHTLESGARNCSTAPFVAASSVQQQAPEKMVPEDFLSSAMLQDILKSTSASYSKLQEQTTVAKTESTFVSSTLHQETNVVLPEKKITSELPPAPSVTPSDDVNDELSDSHDADVNDAASVGSNDSAETVVNFPREKTTTEDASKLASNKDNFTTDNVESPKRLKSRYEMIMERKEQLEVSKTTKRPHDDDDDDDVEHQIDPRLANLCKRFRQTSKKSIPVIKPLPIENNSQKKLKGVKKPEADLNFDDNSKTTKHSTLVKRQREKSHPEDNQHTSNEEGLRSGERFPYRGGFLTKDICQQSSEKKSRLHSKPVNQGKSIIPQRSQTPNIEELHATVDVPGIVNCRLESHIKYPPTKNLVSSENMQHSGFQSGTSTNYTQPYSNYSTPNFQRDPRLNRARSVIGDTVNAVNWSQQKSLLGHPVSNPLQGSSNMGVNASHSQSVKVVTDWNHGNPSLSPVQYPIQQQSNQRSSNYSMNPSLLPTPTFRSFQQPVYEASDSRSNFVPPLPPNEPVQPPLPSPVYSDKSDLCPDMSPSAPSEISRPLLITPPQPPATHNLGRQTVSHNSTVRDSSFFNPPKAPSHFHTARKDVSLLPAPLKNAVGVKIMTSTEVLIIMLSWCVSWLAEQGKCTDPPPICASIKTVTSRYSEFKEYFNTYLPLLLVETWQRIQHEWAKMMKQHHQGFYFHIEDMKAKGDMIEIECLSKVRRDPTHPLEGHLVILKFSDQQENIKIFGYVASHVYTSGDSVSQSPLANVEQQVLHLCVKIIYRLQSSFMKQQVRIHPIYNIKSPLCQVDALRGVDLSPLYQTILHPRTPECDRVVLERVKTTSPASVARAVAQIMNSLNLGDSEPRMTVVDSPFGTDQLTILIALIEHVKSLASVGGNTRILVCTRGITRLREIGVQLIPSPDADVAEAIRTVILAKPEAVSHPELKKLTLVEIVSSHMKYLKEQTGEANGSEVDSDAQSKVLKTCDVLLSIVTNCHESSIHQVLGPKSDTPIKFCILDEAHMCTEPETLVPMLYGIKKFVFFGDPQIKPNARTRLAKENGFKQSLVARLCKALGQVQPAN